MKQRLFKVSCVVCGASFTSGGPNAKYCDKHRPPKREPPSPRFCAKCGTPFRPKNGRHRFCSTKCEYDGRLVYPTGRAIECECCGVKIENAAPRQVVCADMCVPKPDFVQICSCCGDPKGYTEFYDYRYNEDGKLMAACKSCLRGKALKRFHNKGEK